MLSMWRLKPGRQRSRSISLESLSECHTGPMLRIKSQKVFPDDEFAVGDRRFMVENRPTSIIGRLIRPQEIADFAVFVCSGLAGAINGAALRVDGGNYRSAV